METKFIVFFFYSYHKKTSPMEKKSLMFLTMS